MISNRVFTKKINGVTHKVLEGKEIPKGFFTDKEMKDLEDKNIIFNAEKSKIAPKKTEKGDK